MGVECVDFWGWFYKPRAGANAADVAFCGTGIGYTLLPSLFLVVVLGTCVFGEVGAETVGSFDRYGSEKTISSRPVINFCNFLLLIFLSIESLPLTGTN